MKIVPFNDFVFKHQVAWTTMKKKVLKLWNAQKTVLRGCTHTFLSKNNFQNSKIFT